jgi:hypothetical protein
LSPGEQGLYDTNLQTRGLLANVGQQGAGALGQVIGQNVDLSGMPAAPGSAAGTREQVINAMMGRVNQDIGQQRDDANSRLVAAGIRPGTEAYDREMTRLDRTRTDALQQAQIAAGGEATRDFGMDAERRRQAIAEYMAQRQTPLNEITALQSGSQVANPFSQASAFNAGAVAAPAPVFQGAQAADNAAMQRYQTQAGSAGGLMSGLFGLGSSAILASDRRLKRNIHRIGTHRLGIGLYEFEYVWGEKATGVMADEVLSVMPEAVGTRGGYLTVNYALIGG